MRLLVEGRIMPSPKKSSLFPLGSDARFEKLVHLITQLIRPMIKDLDDFREFNSADSDEKKLLEVQRLEAVDTDTSSNQS